MNIYTPHPMNIYTLHLMKIYDPCCYAAPGDRGNPAPGVFSKTRALAHGEDGVPYFSDDGTLSQFNLYV